MDSLGDFDRDSDRDPDAALVRGLRRQEMSALRQAYERHGARIHRLCLRLLGRPADAEDATQEVFLKLFERAASFAGRARFSTWLHRLTVNHCLHRLEREHLRDSSTLLDGALETDPADSPIELLSQSEARESLQQLLSRLTPEHRAVLVLREIEQLSYQEIAETLAIPVGTVMSRLARARTELVRLARARESRPTRPAPRVTPSTP